MDLFNFYVRQTGDQKVTGSIPDVSGNILS